ncbi:hypothetical protein PY092_04090 [Muricauda sp. 334s03]|uniref:Secreted protein n=2 Tax=Flagellimonas TaxID=444459 RepID=A0ABT5XNF7_9FLAO|nr:MULTISPECIES: hypothetical protein [Allomuricauda]MDF0707417.1 hypothetical protein [[Muricauda] okinawensis]MDF0715320.1 hypothetical protein [[Muricauda] yonaguniensis]
MTSKKVHTIILISLFCGFVSAQSSEITKRRDRGTIAKTAEQVDQVDQTVQKTSKDIDQTVEGIDSTIEGAKETVEKVGSIWQELSENVRGPFQVTSMGENNIAVRLPTKAE